MSSGGQQHGRLNQANIPATAAPWKTHLQVPPMYSVAQLTHMPADEVHQPRMAPSWHIPTTDATPLFGLQQMLTHTETPHLAHYYPPGSTWRPMTNCQSPRQSPGSQSATSVDLSLQSRINGKKSPSSQNSPISLSVRDAKQINSLAANKQLPELTSPLHAKRPKVNSIADRLTTVSVVPSIDDSSNSNMSSGSAPASNPSDLERFQGMTAHTALSLIASQPSRGLSPALSNDDSLDNKLPIDKSRRKRKPNKTTRVLSEEENRLEIIPNNSVVEATPSPAERSCTIELSSQPEPLISNSSEIVSQSNSVIISVTNQPSNGSLEAISQDNLESKNEKSCETKSTDASSRQTGVIVELTQNATESQSSKTPNPMSQNARVRQTSSSESETIENIAALIAETGDKSDKDVISLDKTSEKDVVSSSSAPPINLEVVLGSPNQNDKPIAEEKSTNEPVETENIENKLEKMFAGLEKSNTTTNSLKKVRKVKAAPPDLANRPTSTKTSPASTKTTPTCSRATRNSKISSTNTSIETKKISTDTKSIAKTKEYDSSSSTKSTVVGKLRGPIVQIRNSGDCQTINVINNLGDDEGEGKTARVPKPIKKFHDEQFRNRVRGLHSSTLSVRYDTHTKDLTWMCVFCKRGPHVSLAHPHTVVFPKAGANSEKALAELDKERTLLTYSAGDLFGPYYISTECEEYQNSLDYINEYRGKVAQRQQRAKQQAHTAEELYAAAHPNKFSNKRAKRKHGQPDASQEPPPEEEIVDFSAQSLDGMLPVTTDPNDSSKFEIWSHEDCLIWSPGIFLLGLRLVGLEGAVWSCCAILCEYCARGGATVFCLVRNCALVAHVPCALERSWFLNGDTFKAYCDEHKSVALSDT